MSSVSFINFSLTEWYKNYLGIILVEGTPNTEVEAIDEYVTLVNLPTQEMLCITTDGVSVIHGSRNSVTKKHRISGVQQLFYNIVLCTKKFWV